MTTPTDINLDAPDSGEAQEARGLPAIHVAGHLLAGIGRQLDTHQRPPGLATQIAYAQAIATLALAEAQHDANQIAAAQFDLLYQRAAGAPSSSGLVVPR